MVQPPPYVGKDFVHEGCGLLLDPERAWPLLAHATRKNIAKSRALDIRFARRAGSPADLEALRAIWYDPEDPNLPDELGPEDIYIVAEDADGALLGACLLLPVGNHLFLNNLAASAEGRRIAIQERLIWHCVETLSGQGYTYIDIGVSYRQSLYRFFKKFQTISYPVIFHPPEIPPLIRPWPATTPRHHLVRDHAAEQHGRVALEGLLGGRPFTFVPDRTWAEHLLRAEGKPAVDLTSWLPVLADDRRVGFVDLRRVFAVPYGTLLIGVEIDDAVLWDTYGCLDVYKRELSLQQLATEIPLLEVIAATRRQNWAHLAERFELDGLRARAVSDPVLETFAICTGFDEEYSSRLARFGIETARRIDGVHLPIHQGLGADELDYLYGIWRGVLNLCSEWTKTAVKAHYA